MIISFSTIKKLKDSNMYISKGNNEIYDCINNPVNREGTFNLNQYSEVAFDISDTDNQNVFEEISANTRIYIDNLGWWVSTTPTYTNENGIKTKNCKLYSCEYELSQKNLNSFYINSGEDGSIDGVTFYNTEDTSKSLLHLALAKVPNWTISYIHPDLVNKQRTFSIDSINVYSFLTEEVAKTLQCIFTFDTENFTISAYPIDKFGKYMDVYLSNDNVIKTLIQSPIDENGITNCIRVTGSEDLDIRAVNCGFEYIYDLTYFYDKMSPSLHSTWLTYIDLWEDNIDAFKTYQLQYNEIETSMANLKNKQPTDAESENWEDYGIDELNVILESVNTTITDYQEQGYDNSASPYYPAYLKYLAKQKQINIELTSKNTQYSNYQAQLDSIAANIISLKSTVSIANNFTAEQLAELSHFVKEGDYNDNTFAITDIYTEAQIQQKQYDLRESAKKALSSLAQPQYEIQTDIINLIKIPEFEPNYEKLELGNFIVVYLNENYSLDERLISIQTNFDNSEDFNITFSNSTRSVSGMSDLDYLLDNVTGVASSSYSNSGSSSGGGSSTSSGDYVTRSELSLALMNMSIDNSATFTNEQLAILQDMVDGKFDTIDATYIYSKLIEASQAQFDELAAHIITADWVSANEAVFNFVTTEVFNADVGNIKTILSGSIGTGTLQTIILTSENSTVDQSFANVLMANYINAFAIFGSKISTNDFEVGSDDGKLSIVDNTIIIKDDNDVTRVQIGEDANGNFTFAILDGTGTGTIINADGVTENAIADGLIKADKLSDKTTGYNGITSDKLDINSVVTGINNGTTTINSAQIYFDADSQTLNEKFSEMNTTVGEIGTTVESQGTNITTNAQGIQTLITNTTIDNGDGTTTQLKDAYNNTVDTVSQHTQTISSMETDLGTKASTSSVNSLSEDLADFSNETIATLSSMQDQIDGSIMTWFYSVPPTTSNTPANEWTTVDDKNKHLGDLYYDTVTGYCYRWQVLNNTYSWQRITDTDVTKALEDASKAQDTADCKRRVFTATPTTPYEIGDLWSGGSSGELKRCKVTRLTGSYTLSDWELATKYTDDTTAIQVADNLSTNYSTTTQMNSVIDQKANSITSTVSATYATKIESTTNLNTAKSYANSVGSSTLSSAKSDATTKANNALNAANNATDTKLLSYSTTSEMNSVINQTADEINLSVSELATETNNGTVDIQSGDYVESTKSQDSYALCEIVGKNVQNGTPTPTTPIDITSVSNTFTVKSSGKNLISYSNDFVTKTVNGITYTVNDDKTVTANGTATADTYLMIATGCNFGAEPLVLNGCTGGTDTTYFIQFYRGSAPSLWINNYSEDTSITTAGVIYNVRIAVKSGTTLTNQVFRPMVRLATVANNTYEQAHTQVSTITLNAPLRQDDKIKQATEDITAGDGTIIKKGNFYLERNSCVVTLTGSEAFAVTATNVYYTYLTKPASMNYPPNSWSNRFISSTWTPMLNNVGTFTISGSTNNALRFYFPEGVTSAALAKTWLANNSTYVVYPLATPDIEALSDETQKALQSIKTYNGYTTIYTDCSLKPHLDVTFKSSLYGKTQDNKSEIDIQADQIALKVDKTEFNNLTGRVSTAESSITQQANQIALKVNNNGDIVSVAIGEDAEEGNVIKVTGDILVGGQIKSTNYASGSSGSLWDLATGAFSSKNLSWSSNGTLTAANAILSGKITASTGKVGAFTINAAGNDRYVTTGSLYARTKIGGAPGAAHYVCISPVKNIPEHKDTWVMSCSHSYIDSNGVESNTVHAYWYITAGGFFYTKDDVRAGHDILAEGSIVVGDKLIIGGTATSTTKTYITDDEYGSMKFYINNIQLLRLETNKLTTSLPMQFSGTSYPQIYGNDSVLQLSHNNNPVAGLVLEATAIRPAGNAKQTLGSSMNRWSTIYSSSSTISTSDRTKKHDIIDLDTELTEKLIMGLKPSSFKLNEGTSNRIHYGFIAQDVEDLMENLEMESTDFAGFIKSPRTKEYEVETEELDENGNKKRELKKEIIEGEYDYGLRYEEFISPLIKMVQIQESKINELKSENDILKKNYEDLLARVEALEKTGGNE